jgi:hypothetical protein
VGSSSKIDRTPPVPSEALVLRFMVWPGVKRLMSVGINKPDFSDSAKLTITFPAG